MHDIWNPWHGCVKCSEGCKNCYMYAFCELLEIIVYIVIEKDKLQGLSEHLPV